MAGVSGKVAGCCVSRLGWPAPSCERLAHGSSAVIFEALANVRRCPPAFTKSWPALGRHWWGAPSRNRAPGNVDVDLDASLRTSFRVPEAARRRRETEVPGAERRLGSVWE